MTKINQLTKKIGIIMLIVSIGFGIYIPFIHKANAQEGSASSAIAVPISTGFDYNTTMGHIKSFVLDGLAWHIAKIMVQQITASTVQWINSGFQGSPSFLTNPEGYFANVGDQVTGMFISNTGILSNLCSPFNVDVRLSLALNQAGYGESQAYTCTLNSVINNVKNSTVNGASIQGYMNGDFNQGGWPAFIALSQPNNNSSGAYLQAHSDLLQRIGSQQGQVQQQLLQGGGFLSWQDCTDVSSSDINTVAAASNQVQTISGTSLAGQDISQINSGTGFMTDNSSVQSQAGINTGKVSQQSIMAYQSSGAGSISQSPSGAGTYQSCTTQTPGSVINSSLEKVLGSGVDQLNLSNSFNEIVDALLSQLVTQVLHKGLGSTSQKPSGITQSYIDQLSAETYSSSTYDQSNQNIQGSYTPYITTETQTVSTYNQIISMFDTTKASLTAAATCLQNLDSNPSISSATRNQYSSSIFSGELLSQVNNTISELSATEATYQTTLQQVTSSLASDQAQADLNSSATDVNSLQTSSQNLQLFVSTEVPLIQQQSQTSESDMTTAQTLIQQYSSQATQYMNQCTRAGGN